MSATIYDLFYCIGEFLFMIIFMVIAMAKAKSQSAWIWYAIGAAVQLFALFGGQMEANMNGTDTTLEWIVYFLLLAFSAVVIIIRYNKAKDEEQEETPEIQNQGVINNKGMNRKLGTKWFTFYTKVRPWIACLFTIPVITDFLQYIDIYIGNWWLLLYFAGAITNLILCIRVAVKSKGNYCDFVRFVKSVLLFETIFFSYQASIQQYTQNPIPAIAIIIFVVILVIDYFVWYRLNVKYFEKRILTAPNYDTELTSEDKKSQKDIEDMLKAKAEEYRQKGLEPPKTIEMNLAGPGQSTGNKASSASQPFHINLSPADEPPAKDALCDTALQTPEKPFYQSISISPEEKKPPVKHRGYATLGSNSTNDSKSLPSCRKCGTQLLSDSAYCNKCGTKVRERKNNKKSTALIIITIVLAVSLLGSVALNIVQNNKKFQGIKGYTTCYLDPEDSIKDGLIINNRLYYISSKDNIVEEKKVDYKLGKDNKVYIYFEKFDKYLYYCNANYSVNLDGEMEKAYEYIDENGKIYSMYWNDVLEWWTLEPK